MNMLTKHNRPQFRIAVNSRCGRSCFYCRPSGETMADSAQNLSIDDLSPVAAHLRTRGFKSVKITGGDPALYEPLVGVVSHLKWDLGYEHIEVISRHPLLGEKVDELAEAGLDQVNFSFDTVDAKIYQKITGKRDDKDLHSAIKMFVRAGIPAKVNVVFMNGINDHDFTEIISCCEYLGVSTLKFLDVIVDLDQGMPTFAKRLAKLIPGAQLADLYCDMTHLRRWLTHNSAERSIGTQGDLGHPMEQFRLLSGLQVILKDSSAGAWYGSICAKCNFYPCHDALMALRLGPDGNLQFCLLNSEANINLTNIRGDEQAIQRRIDSALEVYETAKFSVQDAKQKVFGNA